MQSLFIRARVLVFNAFPFFLRTKLSLPEKTVSFWSWINRPQELEHLTNPLYESNSLVIWPSVAPQSLLLWEGKRNQTHFQVACFSFHECEAHWLVPRELLEFPFVCLLILLLNYLLKEKIYIYRLIIKQISLASVIAHEK